MGSKVLGLREHTKGEYLDREKKGIWIQFCVLSTSEAYQGIIFFFKKRGGDLKGVSCEVGRKPGK